MPDAIQPFDFYRIFIGDQPWWFGIEILGRTLFMYLYTIMVIRSMGTRTMGQLSLIEFLLVVGIGSAVGDPMLYHDVPLIHGMIVVTVVVWVNRGVIMLINRSEQFERLLEGGPKLIVSHGKMHPENLRSASLNREKLFELLRGHGVRHLGEVENAFLEQGGNLSVFIRTDDNHSEGLRVMPPWDIEAPDSWSVGETVDTVASVGCELCGHVVSHKAQPLTACDNCGAESWVDAVIDAQGVRQT